MCDVSIIIVSYNTKQLLIDCIASIISETSGIEYEIIVSDNGSTDGSVEEIRRLFPEVIIVENNANLGFGAANNRGLEKARGKYILYLNSDTVLLNNAVKLFYDFFENAEDKESIGVVGCYLQNPDGGYSHSLGPFPKYSDLCATEFHTLLHDIKVSLIKFLHLPYNVKNTDEEKPDISTGDMFYVIGADMFLRNSTDARFDERFFLYCEETDMQLRMINNGLHNVIIEGPEIMHIEHGCDKKYKCNIHPCIWIDYSYILYANKNFNKNAILLKILVVLIYLNPYVYKRSAFLLKRILSAPLKMLECSW